MFEPDQFETALLGFVGSPKTKMVQVVVNETVLIRINAINQF